MTPDLWHYTCDHGRAALGTTGVLLPNAAAPGLPPLVWATDMPAANDPEALGLTSVILDCDRTAHRYAITDPAGFTRWGRVRSHYPDWARDALELADGAQPARWWVSPTPAPATLAPH